MSRSRKRALLDTNIWSYVVDSGLQGSLLRAASEGSYHVQIAPAVVFETLRLRDKALRAKRIQLMTNHRFIRLMPEAYSESVEILGEIRRLRPDWLREKPDKPFVDRLEKDWTRTRGGFWVRCARNPDEVAHFVDFVEGDLSQALRQQSLQARKVLIGTDWKRNIAMDKTIASFDGPVPGWRGDSVDMWRVYSLTKLTYGLGRVGSPYRDWIAPFVEVDYGLLKSPAWGEFWLYLVDKIALPRQWLRWAHSYAQMFRKVTPGSAGDTQLFTYFVETDLIITADKALLEILDECRRYAPCALPVGKLVLAGKQGVTELLQVLTSEA